MSGVRLKLDIDLSITLPLSHRAARGAFSYVKRVVLKVGKTEYAAKFISARAKRKASALREMNLLARLDHERILYFHDAFEKKNAVIIVTEMYPSCNPPTPPQCDDSKAVAVVPTRATRGR